MTSHLLHNPKFVRGAFFLTLATCLALTACDTGDEYTEDGQLVEKTDVRVNGKVVETRNFVVATDAEPGVRGGNPLAAEVTKLTDRCDKEAT